MSVQLCLKMKWLMTSIAGELWPQRYHVDQALTPPSQLAAAASAYGEPLFFFTIQNAWHDLFFGANAHFGSGGRVKRCD